MKEGIDTGSEMLLQRVRAATEGEYALEDQLGRGGMATVYLARDLALDRLVAVKVLSPDLAEVEGLQDRFVTEARTAAHLDHPNIITVYSVKELDQLLFIVMKYVEGRTLEQVLEDDPSLELPVISTIITRVAEALHFAHCEGIVHRDVKPSNIMVDTRGRTVVTDFGIAKVASGKSLTVTGSILGTPAYMSPEQCRGETVTPASDQYALGLLTYELLAGRLPFKGSLFELIRAHAEKPPPPLRELVPDVDPDLAETVHRMLEKAPGARWPSLEVVLRRLARHLPSPDQIPEVRRTVAGLAVADPEGAAEGSDGKTPLSEDEEGAPAEKETRVADTPPPRLGVTPEDPTIEVGEPVRLRISEASRQSLGGIPVLWQSEDPSVAEVDEDGVVKGRKEGVAKVKVTAGAAVGRVAVTVQRAEVATLVVTPPSVRLVAGEDVRFEAKILDARGQEIHDRRVIWRSTDPGVMAVSEQGRALAIGGGRAELTVECEGARASAAVRVESTLAPAEHTGTEALASEARPAAPALGQARDRRTATPTPDLKRWAKLSAPVLVLLLAGIWIGTRGGEPAPTDSLAGEGEAPTTQPMTDGAASRLTAEEEGVPLPEGGAAQPEEEVAAAAVLPQAGDPEPGLGAPAEDDAPSPPVETPPVLPQADEAAWIEVVAVGGWAFASLDDGPVRETPAWLSGVSPGERVVRVWRPGFRRILDTVQVAAGDTVRLRYELVPNPDLERWYPNSPW